METVDTLLWKLYNWQQIFGLQKFKLNKNLSPSDSDYKTELCIFSKQLI